MCDEALIQSKFLFAGRTYPTTFSFSDKNLITDLKRMNAKFEFIPGKMDTENCNGELVLLEKDRLEILSNGNLFTENDGLVQIYDQGFCVDTIAVSGRFSNISAMKCQHVMPTKSCTNDRRNMSSESNNNNSCFRDDLERKFRIAYSVIGGLSLVITFFIYNGIESNF